MMIIDNTDVDRSRYLKHIYLWKDKFVLKIFATTFMALIHIFWKKANLNFELNKMILRVNIIIDVTKNSDLAIIKVIMGRHQTLWSVKVWFITAT